MTDRNNKIRSLILAALMVFSVFAGTIALSGTAAADGTAGNAETFPRDTVESTNAPHVVYVGEEVDISELSTSDSSEPSDIPSGSVTLVGVAGDADGNVETISDSTSADFAGFATGTYDLAEGDDEGADIAVQSPEITDTEVNTEKDEDGAAVTEGRFVSNKVYFSPEWNFDEADALELTVTNADGVDITREVVEEGDSDSGVDIEGGTVFTTETNADIALDFENEPNEDYSLTIEGGDFGPSETVTITKGDSDLSVSLNENEVTSGKETTGSVTGAPGETAYVRIDQDAASDDYQDAGDNNPNDFFRNTGDVTNRDTNADYYYAALDLGDDGEAAFTVKTSDLATDETTTVEVASGSDADDSADDDVDLTVNAKSITIDSSPSEVATGANFEIEGSAPEVDNVAAFVKVDSTWYAIPRDGANGNPTDVDGNEEFNLELTAADQLSFADSYRIALVDTDEVTAGDGVTNLDGSEIEANPDNDVTEISEDAWGDYDTTTSTSLNVQEGNLEANLSSDTLAVDAEDELTISGTAVGQSDMVGYIAVGPRGSLIDGSLSINDDNTFEQDFGDNNLQRGNYEVYVIGAGSNGQFDSNGNLDDDAGSLSDDTSALDDSNTQQQNVEIIEDAMETAGSDDTYVELSFTGASATISLDDPGQVAPGEVEFSGTSNREDGTSIFIEVVNTSSSNVVASGDAEVDGDSSTFSTTLDLSGLSNGDYEVRADGDETSDRVTFTVSDVEQTADFQVSNLNPMDVTVTAGAQINVSATVTNEGDASGTQTVEFRVGGSAVDSQEVSLDAGASQTVEFTNVDTTGLSGELTHGVFTDDGEQTATLTVESDTTTPTPEPETPTPEPETPTPEPETPTPSDMTTDDGGDGDDDTTTTGDSGPGFGAIVALVAILGAALIAARRNN